MRTPADELVDLCLGPGIRLVGSKANLVSTSEAGTAGALSWGGGISELLVSQPPVDPADVLRLRAIEDVGSSVVWVPGRTTLITSPAGPTSLYSCESGSYSAWSSHAVVASWLARGVVEINPAAIPELVAYGFVGDTRTHLVGVEAVPPATIITLDPVPRTSTYWPEAERWAAPVGDPSLAAWDELVASLRRRVGGIDGAWLGLTAGRDSLVTALACREAGLSLDTFTWGDPHWPDSVGAARAASELGFPHRPQAVRFFSDEESIEENRRLARWHEGLAPFAPFAAPTWPAGLRCFVTGAGGETGRAFYWARRAFERKEPTISQAVHVLGLSKQPPGSDQQSQVQLDERAQCWVQAASDAGLRGWALLDHVYAEQRVRRWGRGMLPAEPASVVPAFATPRIAAALAAMPRDLKASDGFHRQIIDGHAPSLSVAPPARPRRGVPAPARRAATRARRLVGRSSQAAAFDGWDLAKKPQIVSYVSEEVLSRGFVVDGLGATWSQATRREMLRGGTEATRAALQLGGLAAFEDEVRRLLTPRA